MRGPMTLGHKLGDEAPILVKQEPLLLWLSATNGMLSLCGKCLSQWLVISEDFDMVILKESQKHQGPGSSFSE